MDDRTKEELAELRRCIKDSNASLEALSGALMQFAVHADEQNQALRREVRDHRRLSKYIRRTHFWTMAAMVFGAIILADLAHVAHSGWWGLIYWPTQHGHGGPWEWTARAVGFVWQSCYVAYLIKIAQVPDDLWIAAQQAKKEREQKKRVSRFRA
jgi:hypothetical protein